MLLTNLFVQLVLDWIWHEFWIWKSQLFWIESYIDSFSPNPHGHDFSTLHQNLNFYRPQISKVNGHPIGHQVTFEIVFFIFLRNRGFEFYNVVRGKTSGVPFWKGIKTLSRREKFKIICNIVIWEKILHTKTQAPPGPCGYLIRTDKVLVIYKKCK